MNRPGTKNQTMSSSKSSSRSLPSSPIFVDSSFSRKQLAKTKVTPCSQSVALSNLERLRETRMRRSQSLGFDHKTKEDFQTQQQQTRRGGESDEFKCGTCLFLPKGKAVKPRKDLDSDDNTTITESNLFFDLPLELIRFSDTESPVKAGFVFDKEHHHRHKRVLKRATRKPEFESFHSSSSVCFSTSLPASPCITPRLRMIRDDFNTFLQAQSA